MDKRGDARARRRLPKQPHSRTGRAAHQ